MSKADQTFFSDVLGITDENEGQKLKVALDNVRDTRMTECTVYGWGNNKEG